MLNSQEFKQLGITGTKGLKKGFPRQKIDQAGFKEPDEPYVQNHAICGSVYPAALFMHPNLSV